VQSGDIMPWSIARRGAMLLAFAVVVAASEGNAQNLSTQSLMGRWCGDTTAYTFTPDQLVVTFFDGHPQRILRIQTINIGDDWIEVIWDPRDGQNTVFNEFSGDRMAQQQQTAGDKGPRREFRRC